MGTRSYRIQKLYGFGDTSLFKPATVPIEPWSVEFDQSSQMWIFQQNGSPDRLVFRESGDWNLIGQARVNELGSVAFGKDRDFIVLRWP